MVYDGREVAPAQATSTMFLDSAGKPLPFNTAVLSGRATGVPGAVKMLSIAHKDHGKLPWRTLFGDAERTAREGFIVSPRLSRMIHAHEAENSAPDVIAYFSKRDGTPAQRGRPAGEQALRRLPPPPRCAGSVGALLRFHRGQDRREDSSGAARRHDDHGRPRQLSADQARAGVRPIPRLHPLRAAAAEQRRGADRADGIARPHRYRPARSRRPAGVVPVRRGEPADVRRPRQICRRPRVRARAGRRPDRPHLRGAPRAPDRTHRRSAASRRRPRRRPDRRQRQHDRSDRHLAFHHP